MRAYQFLTSGNLIFGSDKVLQTAWAGARYETGPWAFTGAYYNWSHNRYIGKLFGAATATPQQLHNRNK